jgi:hypothetical protein
MAAALFPVLCSRNYPWLSIITFIMILTSSKYWGKRFRDFVGLKKNRHPCYKIAKTSFRVTFLFHLGMKAAWTIS